MNEDSKALAEICSEPWCDDDGQIVVEYECDESVNIASNVKKTAIKVGWLILFASDGDRIKIKVFQEGKLIAKLRAKKVVIPINKVCAILFNGEVDDDRHDHDHHDHDHDHHDDDHDKDGHGRRGRKDDD
ncbi:MAG: hypothetical protein HPY55_07555 [Firmicutes bacterium]|nr:hypothetical protein [Bacillota bacterium]